MKTIGLSTSEQEKLEREKGCELCINHCSNYITSKSGNNGIAQIIHCDDDFYLQILCSNSDYIGEFKITNCPNCGRDLRKNESEVN